MCILLTGSSGFFGRIILSQLKGHLVKTLNRYNADYTVDLGIESPTLNESFELVIHCGGKAHSVPKTEQQKQAFHDVNVNGTNNLLTGLERSLSLPKYFVFISTVAVYGRETGLLIDENAPLLATDPYGKSKIEAERIIQDWCKKNNVLCTILRLPLLAGPNPPGNLKAMIAGIKKGYYFNIAGGKAKKSIVLTQDVAKIILTAAKVGGIYNLTDGYHPSFYELSMVISKQLNKKRPYNLPYLLAKVLALLGDEIGEKSPINSSKLNKIISDLTFDDNKAKNLLNWQPTPVLKGFIVE